MDEKTKEMLRCLSYCSGAQLAAMSTGDEKFQLVITCCALALMALLGWKHS